jgi:endonuclease/exonuclease/phosphatase family metal-dependent hydrolase
MQEIDRDLSHAQVVFFPLAGGYGSNGVFGNAIFSRHAIEYSAWTALGTGSMLTDDGKRMAGQKEDRVGVYAKLCLDVGSPAPSYLHIITVHVGIFNSADMENGVVKRVADAIESLVEAEVYEKTEGGAKCAASIVLCGDFNAGPTSKLMEHLKDSNWDFGDGFFGTHLSRYPNMTRPPVRGREQECTKQIKKIDYILRRDAGEQYTGARIVSALPHCIISSPASDHYPVVTTLHMA